MPAWVRSRPCPQPCLALGTPCPSPARPAGPVIPEAGPALLVATAVLAQMEGRGHSCLPLKALAGDPNQILAWPKEAERLQQSLWEPLPGRLADWLQALRRSPVVRVVQSGVVAADRGQPLVLLDDAAPAPVEV